jgi:hypothetical protein
LPINSPISGLTSRPNPTYLTRNLATDIIPYIVLKTRFGLRIVTISS